MFLGLPNFTEFWEAGQGAGALLTKGSLTLTHFSPSLLRLQSSQQSMFSSSKFQLLSVPFARLRDSVEEEVRGGDKNLQLFILTAWCSKVTTLPLAETSQAG